MNSFHLLNSLWALFIDIHNMIINMYPIFNLSAAYIQKIICA